MYLENPTTKEILVHPLSDIRTFDEPKKFIEDKKCNSLQLCKLDGYTNVAVFIVEESDSCSNVMLKPV